MAELVVPPMLEQQGRLRRDTPVVGIGDGSPLVDVPANLVDSGCNVVLLLCLGLGIGVMNSAPGGSQLSARSVAQTRRAPSAGRGIYRASSVSGRQRRDSPSQHHPEGVNLGESRPSASSYPLGRLASDLIISNRERPASLYALAATRCSTVHLHSYHSKPNFVILFAFRWSTHPSCYRRSSSQGRLLSEELEFPERFYGLLLGLHGGHVVVQHLGSRPTSHSLGI